MSDLEQKSIERIKLASEMSLHYYGKPLVCTYSGGKDSDVMLELFKRSGVPFEVHNSHTTVDAPPTVLHIRETFQALELLGIKCDIDYHTQPDGSRITMWNLIPKKLMPPTRIHRYCCAVLKETGCANRMIATGVRWDESNARKERNSFEVIRRTKKERLSISDEIMLLSDNDKTRKLFEQCQLKAKTVVNPIIDWSDRNVWEYIQSEHIQTCDLYKMGYFRCGCVGCPMANKSRYKEFRDFPAYKHGYLRAFKKMLLELDKRGKPHKWRNAEEVFDWWMEDKNVPGQMNLDLKIMEG